MYVHCAHRTQHNKLYTIEHRVVSAFVFSSRISFTIPRRLIVHLSCLSCAHKITILNGYLAANGTRHFERIYRNSKFEFFIAWLFGHIFDSLAKLLRTACPITLDAHSLLCKRRTVIWARDEKQHKRTEEKGLRPLQWRRNRAKKKKRKSRE